MRFLTITDIDYFPQECFKNEAKIIGAIYHAMHRCDGRRVDILSVFRKLDEFANIFSIENDNDVKKWIFDSRFCAEEFDFIIRIPWRINGGKLVRLTADFLILIAENSDMKICKQVIDKLIVSLWEEHLGVIEKYGDIPSKKRKVLFAEKVEVIKEDSFLWIEVDRNNAREDNSIVQ